MEPMTAFLLSMQAAGMVTSIFSTHSKEKFIKLGRTLEQEQYSTNLEAIKLQSAESSLGEMKELRQNIGSQIAIQTARGNRGGSVFSAGTAKSESAFNSDERTRRMNLLAKESELRANHVLSGLHSLQSETQLGQSLTKDLFNSIQTTSLLKPEWFNSKNKTQENKQVNPDNFSWGY
jgi:hypothetical protein